MKKISCCKQTKNLYPHDLFRGKRPLIQELFGLPIPLPFASGQNRGNASNGDTQVRWSPPGVVCEPILPTPAIVRTDGTRWTRRRLGLLLGLSQRKHLNILSAPMGSPGASKRSTGHIYPPHRSEHDRLSLDNGRWGQETADCTDTTSAVAFGSRGQALLSQSTALTIGLVGQINSTLGKSILLTHFARSRDWLRLGSATCRSLAARRQLPPNAQLLVRTLLPTATGHTLQAGFLQRRRKEELLSEVPTRSRAPLLPAWSVPVSAAGSTPIGKQFATVLAHTQCRNTSDRDVRPVCSKPA